MTPTTVEAPSRHASDVYKRVIRVFQDHDIDFLVGGAYAFVHYTGIGRDTKDLDLFIRRVDWDRVTRALAEVGIVTELTYPHWLGKAFGGRQREFFVDLIFSGGNGIAEVDAEWFANALRDESLGFPVKLSDTPQEVRYPPPLLNEHAEEIKRELVEKGLLSSTVEKEVSAR